MSSSTPRVVFGAGALARLGDELDWLGWSRVLVIVTPGRRDVLDRAREVLGHRLVGVSDHAALHVPIERVTEALAKAASASPDSLLSLGGGSAVGLAKAVSLRLGLPIVAVPTTYAGSEMTSIWGVTDGDHKATGRAPAVRPRLVIYDPDLTLTLPVDVSAASGMNAIAHAVEAMYAANAGADALEAAREGIRLLSQALPHVVARPGDVEARTTALRGAHAAGVALEGASMGLHHKICHVLGGTFGLPHAPTHAAVLPHVVAFNAEAAPEAMARIADALGASDAVAGLVALKRALGLSATLSDLGFRHHDLDRAAALVTASAYANPRLATAADVKGILAGAF